MVLPSGWVEDNIIYYTPQSKLSTAKKNGLKPEEDWVKFSLLKIMAEGSEAHCNRKSEEIDTSVAESEDSRK